MHIESDLILTHTTGSLRVSTPAPRQLKLQFSSWRTLWAFRNLSRPLAAQLTKRLLVNRLTIAIYLGERKLVTFRNSRPGSLFRQLFLG
jgi:hypothetical protein